MDLRTIITVRDALVEVLKRIKKVNGYRMDLPDDHIHIRYSSLIVARQEDSLYPKCFVIIESGKLTNLPSLTQERRGIFTVLFVVKKAPNTGNMDSQEMTENFIEDMTDLMLKNDTLGGTAQDAQLTEFYTDGGITDPEGVAAFSVEAQWYANNSMM